MQAFVLELTIIGAIGVALSAAVAFLKPRSSRKSRYLDASQHLAELNSQLAVHLGVVREIAPQRPSAASAEPDPSLGSFVPDEATQIAQIMQAIRDDIQGMNKQFRAEARGAATWGFVQNFIFFLLGTVTSILLPKFF